MRISFESFSLVDILCEIGVLSIGFRSQEDCGPFGDLHLLRKAPRYYMPLRILAETYHGNGIRKSMPANEASEFKDAVEKAFKEILAFPVGIELRNEIDSANCDLSVLKAGGEPINPIWCGKAKKTLTRPATRKFSTQSSYNKDSATALSGGRYSQSPCGEEVHQVLRLGRERPIPRGDERGLLGQIGEFYPIAHKGGKAAHTTENILREPRQCRKTPAQNR